MCQRYREGFTLIELLIVVAIIAILAAIAVPNFLEAQTRGKVARAKADMRTIAVAIESYFVDNNCLMPTWNPSSAPHGWASAQQALTTPIAYISTVLADVFQSKPDPTEPGLPSIEDFRNMQKGGGDSYFVDGPKGEVFAYDYDTSPQMRKLAGGTDDPGRQKNWNLWWGEQSHWRLQSAGPDLDHDGFNMDYPDWVYDPTNGTRSNGNIVRTPVHPGGQ